MIEKHMAALSHILSNEELNLNQIHLYKEGIFLKAYDRSAYLFTRCIKSYQVKAKYFKVSKSWVCSIGFPTNALEAIRLQYGELLSETPNGFDLQLEEVLDEETFRAWKETLVGDAQKFVADEGNHQVSKKQPQAVRDILKDRILSFDLANETPMRCILFLAEIQQEFKRENSFTDSLLSG